MTEQSNMQELKEKCIALDREIMELEEELVDLPVSIDVQQKLKTCVEEKENDLFDLTSFVTIQHIKYQIDTLACLTGVRITQVYKSQQSSANVQQIKGEIHGIEFVLKFTTSNEQVPSSNAEKKNHHVVKNLSIDVDTTVPDHIKSFLSKCEKNCCIKDFFQGFVQYCQWCVLRQKTFDYFKEKYPKIVLLDGNDALLHAKTKSECYTVSWENVIENAWTCSPIIDLYISTPAKDDANSHKDILSKFQGLVDKHGIETAIDTLIKML